MKQLKTICPLLLILLLFLVAAGCSNPQSYEVYKPGDQILSEDGSLQATVVKEDLDSVIYSSSLWMEPSLYKDNGIIFSGVVLKHNEVMLHPGGQYYTMYTVRVTGVVASASATSLGVGDIVTVSNAQSSRRYEEDALVPTESIECLFIAAVSFHPFYSAFDYLSGDPFSMALKVGDSFAVHESLERVGLLTLSDESLAKALQYRRQKGEAFKAACDEFVRAYINSESELVKKSFESTSAKTWMMMIGEDELYEQIRSSMPSGWR
ncbi:MAG: hypothetical protein ACLVML_11540 [Candidatus Gastranaerophilaceae bacterium]|nr:hypothetical protein [Christensenellales bacterium]